MKAAKAKTKSANQKFAEKHLANLTTEWFDGYHNWVFVIKLNGETKFTVGGTDEEPAWAEAAEYARKIIADVKERRHEVRVIKMLRAFPAQVNSYINPKDKKALARAIERLEQGIIRASLSLQ